MRRLRPPSTETLFVLTLVLFGFRLGTHAIGDNSMFAHLRTGIDMAGGAGIPRRDPYSFTAYGAPWVVQSWLAEWTYGALYRLGGLRAVIWQQGALMALLACLVTRLASAGTALRTAGSGVIAVGVGAAYWVQRPLLFGLVCLALTVLVVERRRSPWLLVPIVWVWVNTHGSFPLGLAYLLAAGVGAFLDDRTSPRESVRYAGAFVAGLMAATLNPLGPRLLVFAFAAGEKREVFREVTEWRSPNFQRADGFFTLVFLALALLVLLRVRVAWRHLLPGVGFLALGLLAMRNVAPAAIVLAPALGAALRGGMSAPTPDARTAVNWGFAAVLGVAFALFAVEGTTGRLLDVHDYPVAATAYLEREGLLEPSHRIAHDDVVGDYLILRNGRRGRVFADDRFDMYPVEVSRDLTSLIRSTREARKVLDRRRFDVVLWRDGAPLTALLDELPGWRRVHRSAGWAVYRRA